MERNFVRIGPAACRGVRTLGEDEITPSFGRTWAGEAPAPVTVTGAPEIRWGLAATMMPAKTARNGRGKYQLHPRTNASTTLADIDEAIEEFWLGNPGGVFSI